MDIAALISLYDAMLLDDPEVERPLVIRNGNPDNSLLIGLSTCRNIDAALAEILSYHTWLCKTHPDCWKDYAFNRGTYINEFSGWYSLATNPIVKSNQRWLDAALDWVKDPRGYRTLVINNWMLESQSILHNINNKEQLEEFVALGASLNGEALTTRLLFRHIFVRTLSA